MFCRWIHSLSTRFTWPHDSASASASGPSPPQSSLQPLKSSQFSKPPSHRTF